jgi:hypothetical protein
VHSAYPNRARTGDKGRSLHPLHPDAADLLPDLDEPRACTRCMDDFAALGFTLCTPCGLEGATPMTTLSTTITRDGWPITVTADNPEDLARALGAVVRTDWSALLGPVDTQPTPSSNPTCAHGQMVHKTGESKTTGKPWAGWFCPLPRERKDEQCAVVWDRAA